MILGDLNYQQIAGDLRFIQDEKLLAYVKQSAKIDSPLATYRAQVSILLVAEVVSFRQTQIAEELPALDLERLTKRG